MRQATGVRSQETGGRRPQNGHDDLTTSRPVDQSTGHPVIVHWIFIFCLLLLSCGSAEPDTGEDYGNILESPEGLILTEEEHTGGWGRDDCNTCHNLDNIHLENRTDIEIDIEAIHDLAIEGGNAGCPDCHGSNGT